MLRTQVVVAVLALLAVAGSIFSYKAFTLGFPLEPDARQSELYVEARISFEGGRGPVSVRAAVPQSASRFVVLESDALASGFGVLEQADEDGDYMLFEQRSAPGPQNVFYRVRGFRIDSTNVPRSRANRPEVVSPYSPQLRRRALRQEPTPFLIALDEVIQLAESRSADEANFVRNLALILGDPLDERVETIIEDSDPVLREPEQRLVTVLLAADIPARRVVGLPVRGEARTISPEQAVEVYLDGKWTRISARTG
ncbi:MAG: UUP1 family membrane protein, partial [Pseudomonadota bacterium]